MDWLGLPAWITEKHKELRMNLKILRWLLAHKDILLQVVEVVKPWRKDLPLIAHWEIVDKVARLVIPVLTDEEIVSLLSADDSGDVQSLSAADVEVQAMGIDWMTLVKLIIPLLEAILRAMADKDG